MPTMHTWTMHTQRMNSCHSVVKEDGKVLPQVGVTWMMHLASKLTLISILKCKHNAHRPLSGPFP